jgi:hypothetical protein
LFVSKVLTFPKSRLASVPQPVFAIGAPHTSFSICEYRGVRLLPDVADVTDVALG